MNRMIKYGLRDCSSGDSVTVSQQTWETDSLL